MTGKTFNVLVVDDNPADVRLVKFLLAKGTRSVQFTPSVAESLAQALKSLSDQSFDLVLLDLGLPDSNGCQTVEKVRQANAEVAIIVLTGTEDQDVGVQSIRLGADDYLVKGKFSRDLLVRVLRYALERRQVQHELAKERHTLKVIFDTVPVGMVLIDEERILRKVNRAMYQLTNTTPIFDLEDTSGVGCLLDSTLEPKIGRLHNCPDCPLSQAITRAFESDETIRGLEIQVPVNRQGATEPIWMNVNLQPTWMENRRHVVLALENIQERKEAERQIREISRKRQELERIINNSPAVTFLWKAQPGWPTEYVSDNVTQLGMTPADLYAGRTGLMQIVHPDDKPRVINEIARYSGNPATEQFVLEYRILVSGEVRWLNTMNWIRRDEDGMITHYHGVALDVTDRRHAEDALRSSEQRFRELAELLPEAVFEADGRGRLTFANEALHRIFGYSQADLSNGINCVGFVSQDDQHFLENELQAAVLGEQTTSRNYIAVRKSGATFPAIIHAVRIVREGRPAGLRGLVIDITELKQAEEALRQSQEMLQLVMDNIPQFIYWKDRTGVYMGCNRNYAEALGLASPREIVGRTDLTPPWDADVVNDSVLKDHEVMRTGVDHVHGIESRRGTDGAMWLDISRVAIRDHGGRSIGVLCAIEDVTNRKSAEEEIRQHAENLKVLNGELHKAQDELNALNADLENKVRQRTEEIASLLRQKDEFIQQLGHDLKTPLTPLLTLLPMIRSRVDDAKIHEMLQVSMLNVNYMRDLVVKTLQLARLNSSTMLLRLEPASLSEMVREIISLHTQEFAANQISVSTEIGDDIVVRCDRMYLRELLDNVLTNSLKYMTPPGTIRLWTSVDGDMATVNVTDSGVGMTAEHLSRVFDEFYKADESRHNRDSSGLGLSICRRIVEKHGGQIRATSPGLGQGTTISFTLHVDQAVLAAVD